MFGNHGLRVLRSTCWTRRRTPEPCLGRSLRRRLARTCNLSIAEFHGTRRVRDLAFASVEHLGRRRPVRVATRTMTTRTMTIGQPIGATHDACVWSIGRRRHALTRKRIFAQHDGARIADGLRRARLERLRRWSLMVPRRRAPAICSSVRRRRLSLLSLPLRLGRGAVHGATRDGVRSNDRQHLVLHLDDLRD